MALVPVQPLPESVQIAKCSMVLGAMLGAQHSSQCNEVYR